MPTYEYRCKNPECGHEWEQEQRITDPKRTTCPKCEKETAERLISASGFVLNGTCWGRDGYTG